MSERSFALAICLQPFHFRLGFLRRCPVNEYVSWFPYRSLIVDMWVAAAKGQYIKQVGLGGFAMYEVGGDYNGILVQAINQAMA